MIVLGCALLGILLASQVTASASGAAFDTRTLFLTATPNSSNIACTSRQIFIAANTYTWQLDFDRISNMGSRRIFLESANYLWEDCIFGQDDGTYITVSFLTLSGGGTAELDSVLAVRLSSSGNHTFGSQLSL
jgi:hypothetical protein